MATNNPLQAFGDLMNRLLGRTKPTSKGSTTAKAGSTSGGKPTSPSTTTYSAPNQEPTISDMMPQAPDIQGQAKVPVPGVAGQDLVYAEETRARQEYAAQRQDQEQATGVANEVRGSMDDINAQADTIQGNIEADQARLQENIALQQEQLQKIPEAINTEFNALRYQFDAHAREAFDRTDAQRAEALAGVERGRGQALQAAVQGIQGNIQTQIAQIQSNPNLTDAQKQSMVAQVRMSGASSLGATVGQSVVQFNQMAADVATKFGAIAGQIQTQVLSTQGQFGMAQGNAMAQARTAVGQMTNQLLEIDANASAAFATSQTQLFGMRSQAEMAGNQLLLNLLPEQHTPFLDLTGAAAIQYQVSNDIIKGQFAMNLQEFSQQLMMEFFKSQQGNPVSNFFMGLASGWAQGGFPAGLAQGIGASWGGQQGPSWG